MMNPCSVRLHWEKRGGQTVKTLTKWCSFVKGHYISVLEAVLCIFVWERQTSSIDDRDILNHPRTWGPGHKGTKIVPQRCSVLQTISVLVPSIFVSVSCVLQFCVILEFITLCTCLNFDFYCSYMHDPAWCLPVISQRVTQDSVSPCNKPEIFPPFSKGWHKVERLTQDSVSTSQSCVTLSKKAGKSEWQQLMTILIDLHKLHIMI